MSQDLRQLIRGILIEELAGHGVRPAASAPPEVREEFVSIQSDSDLARFTERLLHLTRDAHSRADIEAGRLVFRLKSSAGSPPRPEQRSGSRPAAGSNTETFTTGLVTENRIHRLPAGVKLVRIGGNAVLTPLAKDAMRQAGIKIERVKT